jgi:hypothetical protein
MALATVSIPWNKLSSWETDYIQHTIKMEQEFNRALPNNCFTKLVCFNILRKANKR